MIYVRMFHASLLEMHDRLTEIALNWSRDPLSEVLQDLRIGGVSYGHCRLTAPWGVDMPTEGDGRLHVVVAGHAWIRTQDFNPVKLAVGDIAFVPRGSAHTLSDLPRRRTRPLSDFPREEIGDRTYRLSTGGGGRETILACCAVEIREPAMHPLLAHMPPVLIARAAAATDVALPAIFDAMAEEVINQRVGASTILARLADVVVARLIRSWIEDQTEHAAGWLPAMRDPRIGRAIAAIHHHPGQDWSVDALAKVARLSRSAFCDRFSALTGLPPSRYVLQWRMHLASSWLKSRRFTVSGAASKLGYKSEAAFSRAFKRLNGLSPSRLRQRDV